MALDFADARRPGAGVGAGAVPGTEGAVAPEAAAPGAVPLDDDAPSNPRRLRCCRCRLLLAHHPAVLLLLNEPPCTAK